MDAVALNLPPIDEERLWTLFAQAEEIGLRLEMTAGGMTWEAMPGQRHQDLTLSIVNSVRSPEVGGRECGFHRVFDVAVWLRDGTVKQPDVSIFCARPPEDEGFIHSVPEPVIEITSPGYEEKDLIHGPPLYLRNGVKDVLVLDRRDGTVHRFTSEGKSLQPSPTQFELACGCSVTV